MTAYVHYSNREEFRCRSQSRKPSSDKRAKLNTSHFQQHQFTSNNTSSLPTTPVHFQQHQFTFNNTSSLPTTPVHFQQHQFTFNNTSSLPTTPVHFQQHQFTSNNTSSLPTTPVHFQQHQFTSNNTSSLPTTPDLSDKVCSSDIEQSIRSDPTFHDQLNDFYIRSDKLNNLPEQRPFSAGTPLSLPYTI